MTQHPPALAVEGIKKQFGQVEVLKGVSVKANKGDVIAILGASGSGKSTFLRCINLLETPNEGRIVVAGEEIALAPGRHGSLQAKDPRQLARIRAKLAMVFQSFNLWSHMTILENIVEAPIHVLKVPRKEAVERAEQLLHKVGIFQRRDAYPAHISGGQQQRAAIARALAMEPTVMLFDEPTSALDPELVGEVLEGHARSRRRGPHHARGHPRDGVRPRRRQRGGVPASGAHRGAGRAARHVRQPADRPVPPVPVQLHQAGPGCGRLTPPGAGRIRAPKRSNDGEAT